MPKAYWIAAYRSIHDPEALAAYAKLGAPALLKAGARILARAAREPTAGPAGGQEAAGPAHALSAEGGTEASIRTR